MAIPLTLQATPAFDRSIVPAFQVNFNRIRDALLHASMQVSTTTGIQQGGWPKTVNINVPFKCNILLWCNASYWATSVGDCSVKFKWDGTDMGSAIGYYFNETSSHKQANGTNTLTNVAAGSHTFELLANSGNVASDGADYWQWFFLFFEVI